jgi:phage pi2 protein 07
MKALNALGARLVVPHDRVCLKWIDGQELTLQNFRFWSSHDFEWISERGFRSIFLQPNIKSMMDVKGHEPIDWLDWIPVSFCDLLRWKKEIADK